MEVLYILLSIYLSTWIMIMYRTFNIIAYILKDRKEELLTKYKTMHCIVYGLGTICIIPFIWQIAIFDSVRKRWVLAYCDAVIKGQNER